MWELQRGFGWFVFKLSSPKSGGYVAKVEWVFFCFAFDIRKNTSNSSSKHE